MTGRRVLGTGSSVEYHGILGWRVLDFCGKIRVGIERPTPAASLVTRTCLAGNERKTVNNPACAGVGDIPITRDDSWK